MANETRNTSKTPIGAAGSSDTPSDIFSSYPPAQFTVAGGTFAFPVLRIEESGGNRLIERERPYRDGAKLDDTGARAKQWKMDVMFENTISDSGLSEINGGKNLYPTVLNELMRLFDTHETGDLVVPTVGKRRARAGTYSRVESFEARDSAVVSFTFVEDNEDKVDGRSITVPNASGNARLLASNTEFSEQQAAAWHFSMAQLNTLTSELEGLINAPGDAIQSVRQNVTAIRGNVTRVKQAFQNAARTGRDLFLDPSNSAAERKLVMHTEVAARAGNEARKGRPKLIEIVFRESTSLFRISSMLGQSFDDLIEVNPLLDPFAIGANVKVNVFATEELFRGQRTQAA